MFGWLKKGKDNKGGEQQPPAAPAAPAGKMSKDDLIREAMKNAATAREAIGQETLDKVAEILHKQARKTQLEKMKADLIRKMETDSEKMADQLKYMMSDKDKMS